MSVLSGACYYRTQISFQVGDVLVWAAENVDNQALIPALG
jgi:hypothetical protein